MNGWTRNRATRGLWLAMVVIVLCSCAKRERFLPPPGTANWGAYPEEVKILFGGDTSFGESYGKTVTARLEEKGYAHSLSGLLPLVQASDVVVLNLETPVTTPDGTPISGDKEYVHWTDPEKAPATLRDHKVRLVSLANNHTLDYRTKGLADTLEALARVQIAWVGAGGSQADAERPFVAEMTVGGRPFPLAVFAGYEYSRQYDKEYHFYAKGDRPGVALLTGDALAERIRAFKAERPEAFVVVYPHWGGNYGWKQARQTRMAEAWVQAGADLVIGHGAHLLQEIGRENGRWIVYGLGNFVFNSPGRFKKMNRAAFSLVGQLAVRAAGEGLTKTMRLYPIFSDNKITGFRPHPLNAQDFERAMQALREKADDAGIFDRDLHTGQDDFGRYIEFSL